MGGMLMSSLGTERIIGGITVAALVLSRGFIVHVADVGPQGVLRGVEATTART